MKFLCDNCRQRYSIDDAKVVGRSLRIRCKRCDHIITVKHPASSVLSQDSTARVSLHPQELSGTTAGLGTGSPDSLPLGQVDYQKLDEIAWHYSINGTTYGPFGEDDLIDQILSGKIGDEAYVWNAGMSDWVPAFDVPIFAPAIAEGNRRKRSLGPRTAPKTDLEEPVAPEQPEPSTLGSEASLSDLALESLRSLRARLLDLPRYGDFGESAAAESTAREATLAPPSPADRADLGPPESGYGRQEGASPQPIWPMLSNGSDTYSELPAPPSLSADLPILPEMGPGTPQVGVEVPEVAPDDDHPGDQGFVDPLPLPLSDTVGGDLAALRPGDRFVVDLEEVAIPTGESEHGPPAVDWWVDSAELSIPDSQVEKAFFDSHPFSSEDSRITGAPLGEGQDEAQALISADFPAVYEEDEEVLPLWSSDFAAASEDRRTLKKREKAWREERRSRQKLARQADGAHPSSLVLSSGPHEMSAATRNLLLQLKKAERAKRWRRWIATGLASAVALGVAIGLPNWLGPDDEGASLATLRPAPSVPELEARLPINPMDLDLVNVTTAIREAQTTVRHSTVLGLTESDETAESFQVAVTMAPPVPEGFPLLASEGSGGSASPELPRVAETRQMPRISGRSEDRSQPESPAANGSSRYSRLQNGRTVRVTQENPAAGANLDRTHSSSVDADYFRENLPRVRRDVQRCHELQLREVSNPTPERVELVVTVFPDGHVEVGLERELSGTIFGRCLRTRYPTWHFRTFEGEAVTLRLPFTLQ